MSEANPTADQKLLLRAALHLEYWADVLYTSETLNGGRWPKDRKGRQAMKEHAEHRKLVRFLRRIAN